MEKTKFFRWADLILIVVVIAAALAIFLPKHFQKADGNVTAVITRDGEVIQKIDLSKVKKPYTISLDSHPGAWVTVTPGSIYYSKAECKDKICVRTGKLTKPGDTAACLPSKTLIRLESNGRKVSSTGPDMISY